MLLVLLILCLSSSGPRLNLTQIPSSSEPVFFLTPTACNSKELNIPEKYWKFLPKLKDGNLQHHNPSQIDGDSLFGISWGVWKKLLTFNLRELGKLFKLSKPQFPHLKIGCSNIIIVGLTWDCSEVYEIIHIKKAFRADPGIQWALDDIIIIFLLLSMPFPPP